MGSAAGIAEMYTIKKLEPVSVRPAGKTFNGLYFLSNLDQTHPTVIEIVFAFRGSRESATEVIRESLAKALVHFYPFAGRLAASWDGKLLVRCTGEGVPFVEAEAEDELDALGDISIIDPEKLQKLVHFVDGAQNILDVPLLTVQVTRFKCGGIVLGIGMNHVLLDGISLADFITSWTEIARGIPLSIYPFLDRSIFCPRQPLQSDILHHEYINKESARKTISPDRQEQLEYRSFIFDPEKLRQLKKMASTDHDGFPTSFEVICALVWIARSKALKIKPDETVKLLIAVDGRPKFEPPLPKGYFGNGIAWACAQCSVGELTQKPFSFAVKIVQEAIKVVTEDYIRSAIDYCEAMRAVLDTENTCYVSKWSRLPFYDINFGWGQPTQVAPASIANDLILVLSQGKDSKNIVVSLGLPVSAMKIFEELMQGAFKLK